MSKCEHCGLPLKKEKMEVMGIVKHFLTYDCNCLNEQETKQRDYRNKLEFEKQIPQKAIDFFKENKNTTYKIKDINKSYLLIGNVGSGKTIQALKIGIEQVKNGKKARFYRVSDLLNHIQDEYLEHRENEVFNTIKAINPLILDDLGREKYTEKRLEWVFKIIDNAVNSNQQLVITANQEMIEKLLKIPDFIAIRDRIAGHCQRVDFKEISFRR